MRAVKDEEDTRNMCINLVMAYNAMGGGPGKDGMVTRWKLEKVITEDFGLTIDIKVNNCCINQKMIDDIDSNGNGEIEYDEFESLLS